jgi:ribonuclease Z
MTHPDQRRSHFRFVEPTFCAGLIDDPLLYLFVRPLGTALLFDCGQVHHLAKRVLKSVAAVFITHLHMDHFMGIDTLIRFNHVSPRTIEVFGPPGIVAKMAGKFGGYEWNLAESFWGAFLVHEIHPGRTATYLFSGPEGFTCRLLGEADRPDRVIYRNERLCVEAELCDHRVPALIFRVTEDEAFSIDEAKLAAAGFVGGNWLRLLKKRFYGRERDNAPIVALVREGEGVAQRPVEDPQALYNAIRKRETPASIGYVTDVAFSGENVEKIVSLLTGVTLLVSEASFLVRDLDKARASSHLCTADLNLLLERLRPLFFLPMHLSKSYIGREELIYGEFVLPPETTLLRLPPRLTPRPLLPGELYPVGRLMLAKK